MYSELSGKNANNFSAHTSSDRKIYAHNYLELIKHYFYWLITLTQELFNH